MLHKEFKLDWATMLDSRLVWTTSGNLSYKKFTKYPQDESLVNHYEIIFHVLLW